MAAGSKKPSKPKKAAAQQNSDIARLEQILGLMDKHGLAEFEWERGNERLRFRAREGLASGAPDYRPHAVAPPAGIAPHSMTPPPEVKAVVPKSSSKPIASPFVGTFYRAASPEADPYVREGQMVKRGDTLCIIEAMKLMNEIEAEISGKIVGIFAENGQPVEFGEPLFEIEPSS